MNQRALCKRWRGSRKVASPLRNSEVGDAEPVRTRKPNSLEAADDESRRRSRFERVDLRGALDGSRR